MSNQKMESITGLVKKLIAKFGNTGCRLSYSKYRKVGCVRNGTITENGERAKSFPRSFPRCKVAAKLDTAVNVRSGIHSSQRFRFYLSSLRPLKFYLHILTLVTFQPNEKCNKFTCSDPKVGGLHCVPIYMMFRPSK